MSGGTLSPVPGRAWLRIDAAYSELARLRALLGRIRGRRRRRLLRFLGLSPRIRWRPICAPRWP